MTSADFFHAIIQRISPMDNTEKDDDKAYKLAISRAIGA
jgi:hypothetical protein